VKAYDLSTGWSVLQDVHDVGEELELFRRDPEPTFFCASLSEWEPLPSLGHLQVLLSDQPYYGRGLRHFNEHPWWYRCEFETPDQAAKGWVLRFGGVDYFAKVWLNGTLLGEHEGYSTPFEYEVGYALKNHSAAAEDSGKENPCNRLIVKVWSPWDTEVHQGKVRQRTGAILRNMVKGTYEHADTFIQRDVNPIGLWGKVSLHPHRGIRFTRRPEVSVKINDSGEEAMVKVKAEVITAGTDGNARTLDGARLVCRVLETDTGAETERVEKAIAWDKGESRIDLMLELDRPRLWNTWDRGEAHLYRAELEITDDASVLCSAEETFGIRKVELRRTASETTFLLNGEEIFLRGTSYFPDVYVSRMTRARYQRDLAAVKRSGCNAVRIHVHVEQPVFYELCSELGLAVIQDSDLNWAHPENQPFAERAASVFRDMIRELRNHPCIIAWVCINEPWGGQNGRLLTETLGPRLAEEAGKLDPERPLIRGSGSESDRDSGDSHNYLGSLKGEDTHYLEVYDKREKLNTEFGFDAPGSESNLAREPAIHRRLRGVLHRIPDLQTYQYRLLKYFIEHYRIQKFQPCSGYFQFMFIDLCPQSFYGVYDYWGTPKEGLRSMTESNQPLGIFMEHRDEPEAIWVANDLLRSFPGCLSEWTVTDGRGMKVIAGSAAIDIPANRAVRVQDLRFPVDPSKSYTVSLILKDPDGSLLAENVYRDAFRHPPHPKGHPKRISHELGMRLYDA
jgi:beta-mannosidase